MRTATIVIGPFEDDIAGYRVSIEADGGSQRVEDILPQAHIDATRPADEDGRTLSDEAIHDLLVRESPLPSAGELQRIGDYLGGLIGYGAVGAEWDRLKSRYPSEDPPQQEGLAVMLDATPRDLEAMPWELTRREGWWAFTDPRAPFARVTTKFDRERPRETEWWPLRVTVVIGAKDDDPAVKVKEELDNFELALAKVFPDVHYHEIKRPSEAKLDRELRASRPHVLHFIGHGESAGDSGVLVIHDEEGNRRWDWSAQAIAASAPVTPRIAVLNACRSGDPRPQPGTWAVADAFLKRGTFAVVAIQGDIEGGAAARFSAGLYEALMDDADIHVAVAEGRRRAMASRGDRRDFCLPTLKLARSPADVLPKRLGVPEERAAQIETILPRQAFVDRQSQRRDVLDYLDARAAEGGVVLSVVTGDHEVGTTSLVQWSLRQLALRGREVLYVDLRTPDGERRPAVDVLRAIRDAVHQTRPRENGIRPPDALDAWTHALNHLVRGEPVPRDVPETTVKDNGERFNAAGADLDSIFDRFLKSIWSLTDGRVLLGLDHVDAVDPQEFTADICNKLIRPITLDRDPRIGLVLAGVRVKEMLADINPGCDIQLAAFEQTDMLMLMRQYLRFHEMWEPRATKLSPLLEAWSKPWMPIEFNRWRHIAGNVA